MADGTIHKESLHGTAASHGPRPPQPFRVAPTTGTEFNTLSLDLIPVACVSLHDILFEFDSSFPLPNVSLMLSELPGLRLKHKSDKGLFPPISIFGHADPVGEDVYNKLLSGRRSRAIYGLITHDVGIWQKLFDEEWKTKNALSTMLLTTGQPKQTARNDVMDAYMTALFPTKLDKADFLGKGADATGKADFQGCSEFNPLVILSQNENKTLPHAERNSENQPNRRVVVFLFRPGVKVNPKLWPCPAAADSSTVACRTRFFGPPKTGEKRRASGTDRREFAATEDTFACRFYDRIAHLSPCEKPAPPAVATLEFVLDPKDGHKVDENNPVATFVRMGLWDHAFTCGNPGTLNNDVDETKNFVGSDSRRFYLRVVDTGAAGSVQVKWRTLKPDGSNLDAPADEKITLVETAVGTNIFGSRALMLVSDKDDQKQETNSGLPAAFPTAGVRKFNESDHRIRLADMTGFVEAEYTPSSGAPIKIKLPVFDPPTRRKLSIQVFVLRVAAGGNGVIDTSAAGDVWNVELREIREIYARLGVQLETVVAPNTPAADVVKNGNDSLVLIDPPAGVNPLNVSFNPIQGNNDESKLAAATPVIADTIRVFYTGGLASGNRGEAWPDVDFGTLKQKGCCFGNLVAATYNIAHEMGHILIDKRGAQNGAHYVAPAGTKRLCRNQNLMRNGTSVVEGVIESKRLWDEADIDGVKQVSKIVASHYTHAF